jgi:hypothetical protein
MEQALGLFAVEVAIQRALLQPSLLPLVLFLNVFYLAAHGAVALLFRLSCVLSSHGLLPSAVALSIDEPAANRIRNRAVLVFAIGSLIQVMWPCLPPRELAEFGYRDPIMEYSNNDVSALAKDSGVNPYGSMPSLHLSLALVVAHGLWTFSTARWQRAGAAAYPLMQGLTIVVTGNHYLMDIVVACLLVSLTFIIIPHAQPAPKMLSSSDDDLQRAERRMAKKRVHWV